MVKDLFTATARIDVCVVAWEEYIFIKLRNIIWVTIKITICCLKLKFTVCWKWWNYYLQYAMNKLSIETNLLFIVFKLTQLDKFVLALI